MATPQAMCVTHTAEGVRVTRIPSAAATRADIEAEIERLIALLDYLDGDPELEPWLAENGFNITDDREGGDPLDEGEDLREDDEDNGDVEPSMGLATTLGPMGSAAFPDSWSYPVNGGRGGDVDD